MIKIAASNFEERGTVENALAGDGRSPESEVFYAEKCIQFHGTYEELLWSCPLYFNYYDSFKLNFFVIFQKG